MQSSRLALSLNLDKEEGYKTEFPQTQFKEKNFPVIFRNSFSISNDCLRLWMLILGINMY